MGNCEKCKFFVDTTVSNENGTEYDGYCIIKGDDCFDDNCRWIFPFKQVVGTIKKKKHDYYFNHEYDGFAEFYEQDEKERKKLKELIEEHLINNRELYYKDNSGEFVKIKNNQAGEPYYSDYFYHDLWRVHGEYEDFAHPVKFVPLNKKWANLISDTFQYFMSKIKPYFCE